MSSRQLSGGRAAAIVLLGLSLLAPLPAWCGAKFNRVVEIDQVAPAWKDLPGVDGRRHSLDDHERAKLVVIMFLRNNCPIAQAYEERIRDFVKEYHPRGVDVVAINVSREEGEDLEEMQTRATQHKFPFPYLRDESQQIGKAYGATNTPHVFVLNGDRKIAYMGAIDDNNKPAQVEERYLVDAVEALLNGREVDVTETLQRGCHIHYAKASPADSKSK